jgi:hypothetical protein
MTARSPVYPPESAIKPEFVRHIIKARSEIENGLGMRYLSLDDFFRKTEPR